MDQKISTTDFQLNFSRVVPKLKNYAYSDTNMDFILRPMT